MDVESPVLACDLSGLNKWRWWKAPLNKWINIFFLLCIILAGFLLRYAGLYWGEGYRYFAIGDEINAYRVAQEYLAGHEQARYLGQPDIAGGRVPGPLWALFWALPLKWGASPEGIILLMILLNTAVIPLVYILARKLLGTENALWPPLFYALSPWPAYYAVGAWNPLPMAFFGVLLYLSLWEVTQRSGSAHIFWVCLIMAVMPHFHMIAVFIAPAVLIVLFLSHARISRKWLILGLLAGISVYIPYFSGEIAHNWSNTRAMLSSDGKFSFGFLRVLSTPVDVLSNLVSRWTGYAFADYRNFSDFFPGSFPALIAFNAASVSYSVLYLGRFLADFFLAFRGRWRNPREAFRHSPAVVFMGILLFAPSLLFVLTGQSYFSRYAIVQFPLLFLLPPLGIRWLKGRNLRGLWIAGIAAVLVFNVALTAAFSFYQGQRIAKEEYLIASFRKMERVYLALKADAGPDRRIRLDASTYLTGTKGEAARGILALTEYVNIKETFARDITGTFHEQVYEVLSAKKVDAHHGRVAYKGNGIVLSAVPKGMGNDK